MSISGKETPGTEDSVLAIMAAVKRLIESLSADVDSLVAAGMPDEQWAAIVRSDIAPHLGAEFIATAAASMPPKDKRPASMRERLRQSDGLIAWPAGVEGPATVAALLEQFPQTFAGIDPADVRIIVASPSWTQKFSTYMNESVNLVKNMSNTIFTDVQRALDKVGQGATLFDKQKVVREALSWEEEGGYVGWMRRAETIARTETGTARNTAAHAAAKEIADAGVPVTKRWVAARDERTRPDHLRAHGMIRDIDEPFDIGGEPLQFPNDRQNGSARQTINCRCIVTYLEDYSAQEAEEFNKELRDWENTSMEELERQMNEDLNGLAASGTVNVNEWTGQLAPLGEPTGDGRTFVKDGEFRFRAFPLPLLWQESTGDGHDSSRIVGTIAGGEVTEDGFKAHGVIFSDESKVLELLTAGVVRPSVDLCDMVAEEFADEDGNGTLVVTSATIMAATLVAKPAFENVHVTLTGEESEVESEGLVASLVASAARSVKIDMYSAQNFDDPQLSGPTPVTVTDEGRVYGHLALWDSCHIGMPGRCVKPPRSATGYAAFHQSTAYTDAGPIAVGRLTVGGGHAGPRDDLRAAAEHYDRTGAAWAFVRAGEDQYGIWVSGQVHAEASDAQVNAGLSAPLSGDWRRSGAGLEMVAALSVSTPGFPVRREYSAEDGETMSLCAAASISPAEGGVLDESGFTQAVREAREGEGEPIVRLSDAQVLQVIERLEQMNQVKDREKRYQASLSHLRAVRATQVRSRAANVFGAATDRKERHAE